MDIGIMNCEGGEQEWLRPAVPASRPTAPTESKRTRILKHRTFAPNSFGRSKGEGGKDDIEIAKDDEKFRNGLKRNIIHLSNLTRVNQEQLARLREQVQTKKSRTNVDYISPTFSARYCRLYIKFFVGSGAEMMPPGI
ncbi:unnamed protein product [Ectocarpus sp. CCAP 1310/34]|nr:unnamed protein product [Ectocarpus sp. CCAP 1310/34]